jgi:hypothetical protein
MSGWKTNDLEQIEVKIKIPKNAVAFVVNTLSQEKNKVVMSNTQYDSEDIKKMRCDSND